MKKVLVLSGGGARVIMQLVALKEIEERSGERICDLYDLIVGTSGGAIVGGLLATGLSPRWLLERFYEDVDVVFKKRFRIPFLMPKYSRKNFDKVFNKLTHDKEPDISKLRTKFMCTAVNRIGKRTEYFKSWKHSGPLGDYIKRSFAAPVYFGQMVDVANTAIWFDGGVGTGTLPLDIAYTECIKFGWKDIQITCVSPGFVNMRPNSIADRDRRFNDMKHDKTIKQVWDFIKPEEGGLARLQIDEEKKYRFAMMSKSMDNLEFRLIDTLIPKKHFIIDGNRYKDKYLEYGKRMVTQMRAAKWRW